MARLPSFEQLGLREPSPQTGAPGYQPTSGLEEAPSQAAAKFGETVQTIAFNQQAELNTTRAEDAWNQYKTRALDLSVGNDGFATKRGGDAVNGNMYQTYTKQLQESRKSIESQLGDDDTRRRFTDRANVTDLQFKDHLLRHFTVERDAYEKQTFDGTAAAAASMIAAAPLDQGMFDTALVNVTKRAEALARHQGVTDKDSLDKVRANVKDNLIKTRITALLSSNPVAAESMYNLTKDEITSPEVKELLMHRTQEAGQVVDVALTAKKEIEGIRQTIRGSVFAAGTRDTELVKINRALASDPQNPELLQAKYVIEGAPEEGEARTSGMPTSRQVAAELPLALGRIEALATKKYGPDPYNPMRARYVRMLDSEFKRLNAEDVRQVQAVENATLEALTNAALGPIAGGAQADESGTMVKTGTGMPSKGGLMRVTSLPALLSIPGMTQNYQMLSAAGKKTVESLIASAANQSERGDPALFNELRNRINLPPDDPNKINWAQTLNADPRVQAGALNMGQLNFLRAEIDRSATDDGRSAAAAQKMGEHLAMATYQGDTMLTLAGTRKGNADYAQALWAMNAAKVIGEYKKANKDIRPLFDPTPTNKESLVTPQALAVFATQAGGAATTAQALSEAAKAATTAAPPVAHPPNIDTREKLDAWFQTLPPNVTSFIGKDGKVRAIPGRTPPGMQEKK